MTALRLIIENHPSWQKTTGGAMTAVNDAVPAPSTTIYTLLGRRGTQWHTIVPRIDNPLDAVQALDSANRSQLFDRLVVASAKGLAGQPLGQWETFVCAVPLPVLAQWPKASFSDMLSRAEERHQRNGMTGSHTPSTLTAVKRTKKDASLWLVLLLAVGLWSQAVPVMMGVVALCVLETLYQTDTLDTLIPVSQRDFVETSRFYLYSLCAGLIAIPLLAGLLLNLLNKAHS